MRHVHHQVQHVTLVCLQGSDHAPVRLEMILPLPLPRPSIPPQLSTRFLLTGLQHMPGSQQIMLSALGMDGCLSVTPLQVLVASSI